MAQLVSIEHLEAFDLQAFSALRVVTQPGVARLSGMVVPGAAYTSPTGWTIGAVAEKTIVVPPGVIGLTFGLVNPAPVADTPSQEGLDAYTAGPCWGNVIFDSLQWGVFNTSVLGNGFQIVLPPGYAPLVDLSKPSIQAQFLWSSGAVLGVHAHGTPFVGVSGATMVRGLVSALGSAALSVSGQA